MAEGFRFNLIPKKSKEQIEKEKKRDAYSIYYSFLPLLGVVLFIGLLLFNEFVIKGLRNDWQDNIERKEEQIEETYDNIRSVHGELVTKTQTIAPLLDKDIDPEIVFLVADQIFPQGLDDVTIVGYGRNDDGSFSLSIASSNFQQLVKKARTLKQLSLVKDLRFNDVTYDREYNRYIIEIIFNINAEEV